MIRWNTFPHFALLVPLVSAGCGPSRATDRVPSQPTGPCAQALTAITIAELQEFQGLPSDCTARDTAQIWAGGGDPAGNGRVSGRALQFRSYRFETQPEEITAWFAQDGRLILVTIEALSVRDASELLIHLGEPERKIARGIGDHADADQWVYASRGLTLHVRDEAPRIARMAAYPPTTAQDYEQNLGGQDRTERY